MPKRVGFKALLDKVGGSPSQKEDASPANDSQLKANTIDTNNAALAPIKKTNDDQENEIKKLISQNLLHDKPKKKAAKGEFAK